MSEQTPRDFAADRRFFADYDAGGVDDVWFSEAARDGWLAALDEIDRLKAEARAVVVNLDEVAAAWHDDGQFRTCRERLRRLCE